MRCFGVFSELIVLPPHAREAVSKPDGARSSMLPRYNLQRSTRVCRRNQSMYPYITGEIVIKRGGNPPPSSHPKFEAGRARYPRIRVGMRVGICRGNGRKAKMLRGASAAGHTDGSSMGMQQESIVQRLIQLSGLKDHRKHPILRLRGGNAPGRAEDQVQDLLRWSSEYKSDQVVIEDGGKSAFHGEIPNFYMYDSEPESAWSVRTDHPLPPCRSYFEVAFSQSHIKEGTILEEGTNAVGLVSKHVKTFDGLWWEDDRRNHTWALHDSEMASYGWISDPTRKQERWAMDASFGCKDRVLS
eukprot:757745-Hanusia_phi.AAC.3